jgi:spore coat polysaccharide biosynthesis predicted glycosyltransferase SpsG
MPHVVRIRTSAAPDEGRGHLARALSLAEADWADTVAVELSIASGALTASERDRADAAGARVLGADASVPDGSVIVVDAPDPDRLGAGIAPGRLVVFDDSERFAGEAAMVVQPSAPAWDGRARAGRILAGYRWAPIGAPWRRVVGLTETTRAGDPSLVVCFGGSDPHEVTGRLGVRLAGDPRWATTVVVGPDYGGDLIDDRWVREPRDLPERVAAADAVVIGAGTMKFEVAALGRAALLVAAADDQLRVGPPFAATGAARWLGDGRTVDPERVVEAVAALLDDPMTRATMSAAARRAVDGSGADRLAAAIAGLATDDGQTAAS